jgi:hypothetical protein
LYHDLIELYPHLKHYPEGEEKILQNINHFFHRAHLGADHKRYETLLNEIARHRELCWLLLIYARHVTTNHATLQTGFEFLIKFRSLTDSTFKQDAEYFEIWFPLPDQSLVHLLNDTPVTAVKTLSLQSWSQSTRFKATNTAKRIADTIKQMTTEQWTRRQSNQPDPYQLPCLQPQAGHSCHGYNTDSHTGMNAVALPVNCVTASGSDFTFFPDSVATAYPIPSAPPSAINNTDKRM